jgi:hypothetical protein
MGYTLIDKDTVTSSTTEVDYTIDGTYDEIYFTVTGFKSTVDERNCGYQFIRSGATGYDREIQSSAWYQWLYVHDYSKGGGNYQTSWDDDISDAGDTASQFASLTGKGDYSGKSHSAASGELTIYRPQDTTHYKFFLAVSQTYDAHLSDFQQNIQLFRWAGYVKETAALTGIRFVSCNYNGDQDGNIGYGEFAFYGLS